MKFTPHFCCFVLVSHGFAFFERGVLENGYYITSILSDRVILKGRGERRAGERSKKLNYSGPVERLG